MNAVLYANFVRCERQFRKCKKAATFLAREWPKLCGGSVELISAPTSITES